MARTRATELRIHFLGSGSGGNATLVRWGETAILLDCGFGSRELRRRLAQVKTKVEDLAAAFITHEHHDHLSGLPLLARCPGLPIHMTRRTTRAARWGKKAACERVEVQAARPCRAGPVEVHPFATAHDAREPVGYVIQMPDGSRLGFATDLGHPSAVAIDALADCDLLAIEANHDVEMLRRGPYPGFLKRRILSERGHLSNRAAAALLHRVASKRLQHLFLMHLSQVNNRPALARRTIEVELRRLGLTVPVTVIDQDQVLSYPLPGQLSLF